MRKFALVAAAAVAVASTPALASTSGLYAGVGVTHENVSTSADLEGIGFSGIGGTVFAGYNIPAGDNLFVGVEANFDLSSAKVGDATAATEIDNAFGFSGRIGTNLNEKTSLYGRVGYQRGRFSVTELGQNVEESLDGLRLGAGVETAVSEKVSLRAEYGRTHYTLSKVERDALAQAKGGFNNDQFSLAVVFGF